MNKDEKLSWSTSGGFHRLVKPMYGFEIEVARVEEIEGEYVAEVRFAHAKSAHETLQEAQRWAEKTYRKRFRETNG
jgi:hypothetical protein